MPNARMVQTIVLKVNGLSDRKMYVKRGKTKYDAAKRQNLPDHSSSVAAIRNLVLYQKASPDGNP